MIQFLLLLLSTFAECKKEKKPCACSFYTQENITQITQQENVTIVAFRINLNQTNYKPCAIKNVLKKTRKLLKLWEPSDNRSIQIVPFLVEGEIEATEKPELALLDRNGTIVAKEAFDIVVKERNITTESEVNTTQNAEEESKEQEKESEPVEGEQKEEGKEEEKEEPKEGEEESGEKKGKKDKKDKKNKKDKKDKKKDKKGKKDKKDKKAKKGKKEKKPKVEVETNLQEVLQNLLKHENIDVDFMKLNELKKAQKNKKAEKEPKEQAEDKEVEPEAENATKEL